MPPYSAASPIAMVLQNPRLASSEILEYDEAPLDLSVSNRTRCPSPPRSPYFYRESMSPDYQDYQDRDFQDRDYQDRDYQDRDYQDRDYPDRDYQDRDYQDRDTSSPHDSDDSDSQRLPHPNPAKAYKKAMMRRYRKCHMAVAEGKEGRERGEGKELNF